MQGKQYYNIIGERVHLDKPQTLEIAQSDIHSNLHTNVEIGVN